MLLCFDLMERIPCTTYTDNVVILGIVGLDWEGYIDHQERAKASSGAGCRLGTATGIEGHYISWLSSSPEIDLEWERRIDHVGRFNMELMFDT